MAIIDHDKEAYHVVFSNAGMAGSPASPLERTIDELRGTSPIDIPIRYSQFVREELCRRLGPRCEITVFEGVTEAYLPMSDDLVPEILLSREQIGKWLKILDVFKNLGRPSDDRPKLIASALADLSAALQIKFEYSAAPLNKVTQFAAGLPGAMQSRLLQYTPAELSDSAKVPNCEIDHLAQYAAKKYDILSIIYQTEGKYYGRFTGRPWVDTGCPTPSQKGRIVPSIEGVVQPTSLGLDAENANYSVRYRMSNDEFYWIALHDLP
jgi:hypothetical protein